MRISRSRSVSDASAARRLSEASALPHPARGRAATKVSTSRRITEGWISASPSATTRMAAAISSGSASFSRKPLAPADRASKTYSSMSKVVSTSTRVFASSGLPVMARVASMPFISGMRMSMSTTSGLRRWASATAASPVFASPTISMPG